MVAVLVLLVLVAAVALAAKTCPDCGASNRDDAKFCKSCGAVLPEAEPARPSLPALNVEVTVAPGFVEITSSPDGAAVSVDGNRLGTTPLTSRKLPPGRHELELALSGYRTYHSTLVIPEPKGKVLVRTLPAGAEVLVDGDSRGAVPDSGLVVENLALDSHAFVFRLAGYGEEERTVQLSVQQPTAQLSVEFRPLTGFLKVGSKPDSATVFLNQKEVGTTTYVGELAPAQYQLMVSYTGFYEWYNYVEVRAWDTTALFIALERMRSRKSGLLLAGCVSLAFGGVSALLGEMDYAKYTEAISPGEAQRYRASTQRWDMIRNIAAGVGALGIGVYILF